MTHIVAKTLQLIAENTDTLINGAEIAMGVSVIEEAIYEYADRRNHILKEWMRYTLCTKAKPPITGEITKRKLQCRGIRICKSYPEEGVTRYIIEQRGVELGAFEEKLIDITKPRETSK